MSFRSTAAALLCATALVLLGPSGFGTTKKAIATSSSTTPDSVVVIAKGHVDVGPKLIDGTWQAALRDDTVSPPVWRKLKDVVLHVTDPAKTAVPDSADYSFLNLPVGSTPWVIPQTQNPEVVWVGWNTQDPEAASLMGRGTNLVLNGMTGPAPVNVFLQDGGFGPPRVLWQTDKGAGQSIWMEVNSHVHVNWVFPTAGEYAFDVSMVADSGNPEHSARGTLRVVVGSTTTVPTDTNTTSAEQSPTVSASATTNSDSPAPTQPGSSGDSVTPEKAKHSVSSPLVMVGVGGVAVVVATIIGTVLWRGRQARAASEKAFPGIS